MTEQNLSFNLVWEAGEIAKVIGRTDRQTHYMLVNGDLPAKKIGGRWCAERSQLTNWFMDQLSGGAK